MGDYWCIERDLCITNTIDFYSKFLKVCRVLAHLSVFFVP